MATQGERIESLEAKIAELEGKIAETDAEAVAELQETVRKQNQALKLIAETTKTMNENHTEITALLE